MSQNLVVAGPWGPAQKILFRFFFLFFILYIFFNPNGIVPGIDEFYRIYIDPFFQRIIPWIGKHVLHLPYDITVFYSGSGDKTLDYVALLLLTVLAVAGCLLWSLFDRNRKSYNQLYYWLTVVVRYYLAFTMLNYGFYKVFKIQFPFPGMATLIEPYGESSPMGLAWTFMGYSQGYNYFTGGAEVLGGLLLLFRKTTLLGTFVSFGVMSNVMAMNYCYDIPVKLLSTALVVMCLFLMVKDMRRLCYFFVLNKPAPAGNIAAPRVRKQWLHITLLCTKGLLIAYTLVMTVYHTAGIVKQYGDLAPKPPLTGIYNVETFVKNNDTVPPLQTDTMRWKQFVIGGYRNRPMISIKGMNDSIKYYASSVDTVTKMITVTNRMDTSKKYLYTYAEPDPAHIRIIGNWKGDSVMILAKKYNTDSFLLIKRGFHWVNEYPFNR